MGLLLENILTIKKVYYVVSTTPSSGNKSNWHRRGRNKYLVLLTKLNHLHF